MDETIPMKYQKIGIFAFLALVVGLFLTGAMSMFGISQKNTETNESKQVTAFIVETRQHWSSVQERFIEGRKAIFLARSIDSLDEKKVIEREVAYLQELKDHEFGNQLKLEKNERLGYNVKLLIGNAINELELAVQANTQEDVEKYVGYANTQIELANKSFLEIAVNNGYDIRPLAKVDASMN